MYLTAWTAVLGLTLPSLGVLAQAAEDAPAAALRDTRLHVVEVSGGVSVDTGPMSFELRDAGELRSLRPARRSWWPTIRRRCWPPRCSNRRPTTAIATRPSGKIVPATWKPDRHDYRPGDKEFQATYSGQLDFGAGDALVCRLVFSGRGGQSAAGSHGRTAAAGRVPGPLPPQRHAAPATGAEPTQAGRAGRRPRRAMEHAAPVPVPYLAGRHAAARTRSQPVAIVCDRSEHGGRLSHLAVRERADLPIVDAARAPGPRLDGRLRRAGRAAVCLSQSGRAGPQVAARDCGGAGRSGDPPVASGFARAGRGLAPGGGCVWRAARDRLDGLHRRTERKPSGRGPGTAVEGREAGQRSAGAERSALGGLELAHGSACRRRGTAGHRRRAVAQGRAPRSGLRPAPARGCRCACADAGGGLLARPVHQVAAADVSGRRRHGAGRLGRGRCVAVRVDAARRLEDALSSGLRRQRPPGPATGWAHRQTAAGRRRDRHRPAATRAGSGPAVAAKCEVRRP